MTIVVNYFQATFLYTLSVFRQFVVVFVSQ